MSDPAPGVATPAEKKDNPLDGKAPSAEKLAKMKAQELAKMKAQEDKKAKVAALAAAAATESPSSGAPALRSNHQVTRAHTTDDREERFTPVRVWSLMCVCALPLVFFACFPSAESTEGRARLDVTIREMTISARRHRCVLASAAGERSTAPRPAGELTRAFPPSSAGVQHHQELCT